MFIQTTGCAFCLDGSGAPIVLWPASGTPEGQPDEADSEDRRRIESR